MASMPLNMLKNKLQKPPMAKPVALPQSDVTGAAEEGGY